MAKNTPGKAHRHGVSFKKLMTMFPDDGKARAWLEAQIWPQGPICPHCDSFNVLCGIQHKTMTHRCRDFPNRPRFSLKVGSIMQSSDPGCRNWAIALLDPPRRFGVLMPAALELCTGGGEQAVGFGQAGFDHAALIFRAIAEV